MKAAQAATKSAIIKTPENGAVNSEFPDQSAWEKAIHDWENEGGALGMSGSSLSTKERCEPEIFATNPHWESRGESGPDECAQDKHQIHDPVCPHCVNPGA